MRSNSTSPLFVRTAMFYWAATSTDCKERAMRVVCAQGIAEEVESDVYRHNSKSLAYITGSSKFFFQMLCVDPLVLDKIFTVADPIIVSIKTSLSSSSHGTSRPIPAKTYAISRNRLMLSPTDSKVKRTTKSSLQIRSVSSVSTRQSPKWTAKCLSLGCTLLPP